MIISLLVAVYFEVLHERFGFEAINESYRLVLSVGVTTAIWLIVTFMTVDLRILKPCSISLTRSGRQPMVGILFKTTSA